MILCFSPKYRVIPAKTLTSFNANIFNYCLEHGTPNQRPQNISLKYIILYICLTSEADGKELQYLQCHANCSVFQVLICLKSKKKKSGTLVLSLVFDVHIPHLCSAIHLDPRPVTPVSRLSEIRMSTVVSLETLKLKAVMNKQRMNATEFLLRLTCFVTR